MIKFIILMGLLSVLAVVALKGIQPAVRKLVCWCIAALALTLSAVVFLTCSGTFSVNAAQIFPAVMGFLLLAAITAAVEMLSPSRIYHRKKSEAPDILAAEKALDLVLAIVCFVMSAVAVLAEVFDTPFLIGLSTILSSAISIRQTAFHLRLSASEPTDDAIARKDELLRKIRKTGRKL